MANYTNKNGTNSADILTYNNEGTYHAYGGNDTIKITAGSGIVVYTDSGNNIINVTGGRNIIIKVADKDADSDKINGVEKLTINGAAMVEGYLGSGKDEITLLYTNGKKTTGALSQLHGGAWTDTFTIGNGAMGYQLYGDAGDDIFNINSGSDIVCWGGAANDTFNVNGGTGIKLRGGDSADIYNIYIDGVDMQLGYGNDVVNVNKGSNQAIKANLGINTINLKAGSGHVITADIDQAASKKVGKEVGYGVDKVYISGTANRVTANLGDGKDEVSVACGSGHNICTEGWGDTINIYKEVVSSTFDAGAGDDVISVFGGSLNTIIGNSGNDKIIVKQDAYQSSIYGGSGDDNISIEGSRLKVYGDYSNNNGYKLDPKGTTYNDVITVTGEAELCQIDAGKGNDVLKLDSWYGNEVYAGDGDDTIYISTGYDIYKLGTNPPGPGGKNAYAKVSGGAGNDTFKVNMEGDIPSSETVLLFGGSGNDIFELDDGGYFAYGGTGDDTFYANAKYQDQYMIGGAGNDTYCIDFSLERNNPVPVVFKIDNHLYHEAADKDVLKISGYDGALKDIKLFRPQSDKDDSRSLQFSTSRNDYIIYIDGMTSLSFMIQDKTGGWSSFGNCDELEAELRKYDGITYASSGCFDWDRYYDFEYGPEIQEVYGTVEDFINRDSDLKITGNGK